MWLLLWLSVAVAVAVGVVVGVAVAVGMCMCMCMCMWVLVVVVCCLPRNHLPRMLSLITNEGQGIENIEVPSSSSPQTV